MKATTATQTLRRATPSSVGVDATRILDFLDEIAMQRLELHSFMLLHKGAVIAEGAWRPYELSMPHMQHSATKSWVAAAVGLAFDDGLLQLTDRVIDFFPEHLPAAVSDNLAAMTVRDLLTMRTGHRTGISGGEWRTMASSWVAAFLAEPVEEPPGENFIYGSGASYMLSAIVTKVTGRTAHDLMRERVFEPLGMTSVSWDISPEGYSTGGNGLTCTTEDSIKFGYLHLQGGNWHGKPILSEAWVREATRNQVRHAWLSGSSTDGKRYGRSADPSALKVQPGYGYQWWMTPFGGYRAAGMFGQECIVLPEHDAVIAFTAGMPRLHPGPLQCTWQHLVPALEARTSFDASMDQQLRDRLASLSLDDAPAGQPHAELESTISGKRWRTAANDDAIEWIQLDFRRDACLFSLQDARGVHQIEVGLGRTIDNETSMTGNRLHHQYQPDRMRVVAQGAWSSPAHFLMRWRFVGTAFCDTVECTFEGERLRFDRSVNTNSSELKRPTVFANQPLSV